MFLWCYCSWWLSLVVPSCAVLVVAVFFGGLLVGPLGEVLGADLGEPVGDYLREALAVAFGGVLVAVVCLGGPSGEVFCC